jgi:hypothetical protein
MTTMKNRAQLAQQLCELALEENARRKTMLNKGDYTITITLATAFSGDGGDVPFRGRKGDEVRISEADLVEYRRDPDLFAARHFGFATVEDYVSWVTLDGCPRCAGTTKDGKPCQQKIVTRSLGATRFRELHRSRFCSIHHRRR